jgi:uncharacterized protein (TIGR00255 family)
MTGFGKGEVSGENFTVITEIKTVNNRFKDFRFRMSSLFNSSEMELRRKLEEEFKRGSFEINITYKKNEKNSDEFLVDRTKINKFLKFILPDLRDSGLSLSVNPTDFLRTDFYKDDEDQKESELLPLMFQSFHLSLIELKKSRLEEGRKLVEKLREHLDIYQSSLIKVENIKSQYPNLLHDRLSAKLTEKLRDFKVDESRLSQEIIYYLEKLEVDEEINRAKIHLEKLRLILSSSGEVGRQIDFLLQELGRETNTLGSKSAHVEISSQVIEMKVQLEKIREQALNLE